MRESLEKVMFDINKAGQEVKPQKVSNKVLFYFDLRVAKDM